MTREEKEKLVPIWKKTLLTLEEAGAYTGIGQGKLREMTNAADCDFVVWIGSRRMLKRKQLEAYLDKVYSM